MNGTVNTTLIMISPDPFALWVSLTALHHVPEAHEAYIGAVGDWDSKASP